MEHRKISRTTPLLADVVHAIPIRSAPRDRPNRPTRAWPLLVKCSRPRRRDCCHAQARPRCNRDSPGEHCRLRCILGRARRSVGFQTRSHSFGNPPKADSKLRVAANLGSQTAPRDASVAVHPAATIPCSARGARRCFPRWKSRLGGPSAVLAKQLRTSATGSRWKSGTVAPL